MATLDIKTISFRVPAQNRHLVVNGAVVDEQEEFGRRSKTIGRGRGTRGVGLARYGKSSTWFNLGPFSEDRDNGPTIPVQSGSRTSDKAPLFEFGES